MSMLKVGRKCLTLAIYLVFRNYCFFIIVEAAKFPAVSLIVY